MAIDFPKLEITAVVASTSGASIARSLVGTLDIDDKVAVAVMHNTGAALNAVSGWTKAGEAIRLAPGLACTWYWADVINAGQQTSLKTFTYPTGGGGWREIRYMVSFAGALPGAPNVAWPKTDGAAAVTGSTGTSPTPSAAGGLCLALVVQSANNGGEVDDATYPTNGFSIPLADPSTTHRALVAIKENVTAAAQETQVKWVTSQSPAASMLIFLPVVTGPPPNQPPTANAGANQTVEQGDIVTFAGSGSDTDGTIAAYEWTAPTGVTLSSTSVAAPTWGTAAAVAASYNVSLRVQDNDGAWSTPDVVTITVTAPPVEPEPGVTPVPQFQRFGISVTTPANAASADLRTYRQAPVGAEGKTGIIRRVSFGPGTSQAFSLGGTVPLLIGESSLDNGATTAPLRNEEILIGPSLYEILDGEAPPDTEIAYRFRTEDVVEGVVRSSNWSPWAVITPRPTRPSIKVPADPEGTNINLHVVEWGTVSSSRVGTEHHVFASVEDGVEVPSVFITAGWTAARGDPTVYVESIEHREQLRSLLRSGAKLVLQKPSEDDEERGEQWHIQPLSDLQEVPVSPVRNPGRYVRFSWQAVQR